MNKASFTVQKGEFVALVGQSGSGKTTLLNMIGCIDRPTSGRVLLEEKDLTAMEDEALAALYPGLMQSVTQVLHSTEEKTNSLLGRK